VIWKAIMLVTTTVSALQFAHPRMAVGPAGVHALVVNRLVAALTHLPLAVVVIVVVAVHKLVVEHVVMAIGVVVNSVMTAID
jgi:hypothetical protein